MKPYLHHVEYFYKNDAGTWELSEYKSPADEVKLRSVPAKLPLAFIYERVRWE